MSDETKFEITHVTRDVLNEWRVAQLELELFRVKADQQFEALNEKLKNIQSLMCANFLIGPEDRVNQDTGEIIRAAKP